MRRTSVALFSLLALCSVFGASPSVMPQPSVNDKECVVTLPSERPIEGAPWSDELHPSRGWYGSTQLAALLPSNGKWKGMGPDRAFGDKFWWWRSGYSARKEMQPDLVISAKRLDGPVQDIVISGATNAYGSGWDSMLIGMEFPEAGCWKVTGTYNGSEELTFVLQVGGE
jgi:hypothetical protein